MKYSLMSLMIGSEIKVTKPSLFQRSMLRGMGYQGEDPTLEEMYAFFASKGIQMQNGSMSFRDLVKFAYDAGYDGLDMMFFHFEEDPREAKKILEEYGIALSSVGIISQFTAAETEEDFQKELDIVRDVIDRASIAGCESIMMMPTTYVPRSGMSREQAFQTITRALREIVAYAQSKNLVVHTETLESTAVPLCSIGEMKRVFDAVPGLKYTHDSGNPLVAVEDPLEEYEAFKELVSYVHFKDLRFTEKKSMMRDSQGRYLDRAILGEGLLDFRAQLKALKRDGYEGYISLEGLRPGENILAGAAAAVGYFREMEKELES